MRGQTKFSEILHGVNLSIKLASQLQQHNALTTYLCLFLCIKLSRYETKWDNGLECKDIIKEAWRINPLAENNLFSIPQRLRYRANLMTWSKSIFGQSISSDPIKAQSSFQVLTSKSRRSDQQNQKLAKENRQLLGKENIKWIQRAKAKVAKHNSQKEIEIPSFSPKCAS